MYVETVPNRGSPSAVLLRESFRRAGKVVKRTLANLSDWPAQKVETLRRLLHNEDLVSPRDLFVGLRSLPHGHVEAVLGTIRRLGLDRMLSTTRCRERDLVVAMIASRLLHPASKLATSRLWHCCTLAEELGLPDTTDVDELYDALDWLLARQKRIEKKLAARHLVSGGQALYDVSSSYYYGRHCILAALGHDRDHKHHFPIIVYGLLTDPQGRPVAVNVYSGDTGDPATVPDQVTKLRDDFGLADIVLVGDRGMLTQTQLETVRQYPGLGWISALRSPAIRKLVDSGPLQLSLFDKRNLAEISSPGFPGERLIACFNPLLAEERKRKREELLDATEKTLRKISKEAARRTKTPFSDADLGVKTGRVLNRYKMAKHFQLTISGGRLSWVKVEESIRRERELDGIYVIRTNQPVESLSAADVVRTYKGLARVEQAFRCIKQIDLSVRPIRHRTEDHVRAHVLLCMLAYYVDWHMRRALAPLLFEDEDVEEDRCTRDPVAKAEPSPSVKAKKAQRQTPDGLPVQSFRDLLAELGTRAKTTHLLKGDSPTSEQKITLITEPTPLQTRALQLLGLYPVDENPK